MGRRMVAEEIQRQTLSLMGCTGAEGKNRTPALGLRKWMAGDVTNIAKAPQGGAGGNTLSSSSASEGGLGLLRKKDLGKRLQLQGLGGPFCHQEAALRNEAVSPWEARRGWDGHTGHWPLDTACPGGCRMRPLPANSKAVFLLWTCTGSLRRGLTACTRSHGAGGTGRGQGVSGHALACPDPFRGPEGWLVLPVVSWRPES